ncbi:DNA translocase FtsK [Flavobacterium sp. xlx-214]|uniref:DNA translocase FtsK n=1 Tax=unclassified Flavobacterium TaxID=196869 RepID=UPI0013D2B6A3|nr:MULTISPECIES: DNA translocase FtsK [unclassified Flavobacterium]MBA5791440.1 DNA translocase FtsK [Flavobacterium sp. xlx-221]QMI83409.1 DNA translocase FtsK [Flavobacterium sp. xlx-214]
MTAKKKANTQTKQVNNSKNTPPKNKQTATNGARISFILGTLFLMFAIILLCSFISYFTSGAYDQSIVKELNDRSLEPENWVGKLGAWLSHKFIFEGFGVASFIFVKIAVQIALWFGLKFSASKLRRMIFWDLFAIIVIAIALGHFGSTLPYLGGVVGFEINDYIQDYFGEIGALLTVVFLIIFYLIFRIKMTPSSFTNVLTNTHAKIKDNLEKAEEIIQTAPSSVTDVATSNTKAEPKQPVVAPPVFVSEDVFEPKEDANNQFDFDLKRNLDSIKKPEPTSFEITENVPSDHHEEFIIETIEEETLEDNVAAKIVEDFGMYDPTLELSKYQFPTSDLLFEHASGGITINQAELEENKNRIVETLNNYKIGIAQIKATVGPTVTLYEIVPDAGIRISKIKSLEDDIALSLAALGIRIIAPIPGKGTIGIEVPNTTASTVSMKSLILSPKFQNAEMELPIALGKTISNETFVFDLAKMPHLLMAGATGQGKSVGLNAVLASLLYKKHPAEVKFVLVDPKKVELTLFNKIERHFLAKLPDTEDAIITDNTKVINTLNSLCIEMDNRYSLLKDAMVRNIKEYNEKFKLRKLNPENGHRFLPYIVLVVDEFADLIMTAGKEVETPIARLAQLARAIGIHLIIATQRPSVNVITGIIKANFPARIAFRVSSKIDSRTILDGPGADQLIGRGDLLFTQGNELVRVQCGFVDTPEVEKITEFIGAQKAYSEAYLLPEYVGEESGTSLDIDISERDAMFREAAEIIVTAQQGSASLLQRKLKLGYNRAGRLIDQLEAAGIVGPFEGSKARSVNIPDLISLDEFLENEKNRM